MKAPCMWCKRPLIFTPGKGWTHTGGAMQVRRCRDCASTFDTPELLQASECPMCGGQLVDDHAGLPSHG